MKDLALILLAAGTSTRMGDEAKLLLPLNGEPLVTRTLQAYESLPFAQKIVVLGADEEAIAGAIKRIARDPGSLQFVRNENYESGLRSSLQAGVRALRPEISGVMVVLADQPFLESETLLKIVSAFQEAARETNPGSPRLFVPISDGRRGNPVILSSSLFEEILTEDNEETLDQGARFLFEKYPESVELIEVGTPSIHMDIDTQEEYEKFLRRSRETKP